MKYFKRNNAETGEKEVFAYDDDLEQSRLDAYVAKNGLEPMTQAEIDEHTYKPEPNPWDEIRTERDRLLNKTQWIMDRHSEQVKYGLDTTLTEAQIQSFAQYRQDLRDIPQTSVTIDNVVWPQNPLKT